MIVKALKYRVQRYYINDKRMMDIMVVMDLLLVERFCFRCFVSPVHLTAI